MKHLRTIAFLCDFALLLSLVSACGDNTLSVACVGCAAGTREETIYQKNQNDALILPAEFVTAYALHTLGAGAEECRRVLYGEDVRYYKQLLSDAALTPAALLEKLNAQAKTEGLALTFGSLCGLRDRETELYQSFGLTPPEFAESTGTRAELKKAAEIITSDEALTEALSTSVVTFADGSKKTRKAPLVSENSQFRLASALWYLGGTAIKDGRTVYVALAALKEDAGIAYGAVCEDCGENGREAYYASCDLGNTVGLSLGVDYGLAYSSSKDPEGAGMVAGASIFGGAVLIIFIVVIALLVIAVGFGIFGVVKRNREGRRRYAGKDDR